MKDCKVEGMYELKITKRNGITFEGVNPNSPTGKLHCLLWHGSRNCISPPGAGPTWSGTAMQCISYNGGGNPVPNTLPALGVSSPRMVINCSKECGSSPTMIQYAVESAIGGCVLSVSLHFGCGVCQ